MATKNSQQDQGNAASGDGRRERGRRRERAVLDVAYAMFVKQGYRSTTLEAIIAEAGGSRETIYRAFGGKRGLLSAIISQVGDPIAASIEHADETSDPRDVMRDFGLQLLRFWLSPVGRAMNRMVVSEGIESNEIFDTWYQSAVRPSFEVLTNYLERQRHLAIDDVGMMARQFLLLLMGESAFSVIFAEERTPSAEEIVERSLDLVLRNRQNSPAHLRV